MVSKILSYASVSFLSLLLAFVPTALLVSNDSITRSNCNNTITLSFLNSESQCKHNDIVVDLASTSTILILLFALFLLAVLVAIVWTALDRKAFIFLLSGLALGLLIGVFYFSESNPTTSRLTQEDECYLSLIERGGLDFAIESLEYGTCSTQLSPQPQPKPDPDNPLQLTPEQRESIFRASP